MAPPPSPEADEPTGTLSLPGLALDAAANTAWTAAQAAAPAKCSDLAFGQRAREAAGTLGGAHAADLPKYVEELASPDRAVARQALAQLFQLTSLAEKASKQNQEQTAALQGTASIVKLMQSLLAGEVTQQDEEDVMSCTWLLQNLSSHDDLIRPMAANADLVRILTGLLAHKNKDLVVNACKVLINLTYIDTRIQAQTAAAGGTHSASQMLFHASTPAVLHGAWLLSNLVAGHGSEARDEVVQDREVVDKLSQLLTSSDGSTLRFAAEVVGSVARAGPAHQLALAKAGVLPRLVALVGGAQEYPQIVAAALGALAALVLDSPANTRALVAEKSFVEVLEQTLDRSNIVTQDYDVARTLAAAHTLIYALGHMADAHGIALVPPADVRAHVVPSREPVALGGSSKVAEMGRADVATAIAEVLKVLKDSKYLTLVSAAQRLGLALPPPRPLVAASGHDADVAKGLDPTSPLFTAEVSFQVNQMLLPDLRRSNARLLGNASARLYQMVLAVADLPQCRIVMSNPDLVAQLLSLLDHSHSGLLQAALGALGALSGFPEVCMQLLAGGLEDKAGGLAEHRDPLVRLTAERVMVALYLAAHGLLAHSKL